MDDRTSRPDVTRATEHRGPLFGSRDPPGLPTPRVWAALSSAPDGRGTSPRSTARRGNDPPAGGGSPAADAARLPSTSTGQFSRVLARNIDGLLAARREAEHRKRTHERISDAVTHFTGSLRFVYIHAVLFGGWIIWNLGWIPGLPVFDPSFVVLAMAASVEAIFLSTFVLISQNRMQAQAEKRAELDLQISLLAEHEVTQIMTLLDAIARHVGLERAADPEIEEVKQDVDPRAVLDAIERQTSRSEAS